MDATISKRGHATLILSKAFCQFPNVFRSQFISKTSNVNLVKCGQWWKEKATILKARGKATENHVCMSNVCLGSGKRVHLKAGPGSGKKAAKWVNSLYHVVLEDFVKLKSTSLGLKFSLKVLFLVARNALVGTPHPTFQAHVSHGGDPWPFLERITSKWV